MATAARIWLRPEVFEHGVLPYTSRVHHPLTIHAVKEVVAQAREVSQVTIRFFTRYDALKVVPHFDPIFSSEGTWLGIAKTTLQWQPEEAQVFWGLLEFFCQSNTEAQGSMMADVDTVRMEYFGQFLFAHLDTTSRRREAIDSWNTVWLGHDTRTGSGAGDLSGPLAHSPTKAINAGGLQHSPHHHSPQSPRTVGLALRGTADQDRLRFVRSHFSELLAILFPKSAIEPDQSLSVGEVDLLGFLLAGGWNIHDKVPNLSQLLTENPAHNNPPSVAQLEAWVTQSLIVNEVITPPVQMYMPGNYSSVTKDSLSPEMSRRPKVISGQNKITIIKTEKDFSNSDKDFQDLVVSFCEDSFIYVCAAVRYLSVIACNNCVIVVGAVSAIATVERCEKLTMTLAANHLHLSNILDSSIFAYTPSRPILLGDTYGVRLGPHNTYYPLLQQHLKTARIALEVDPAWGKFDQFHNLSVSEEKRDAGQKMSPRDFRSIVIPATFDTATGPLPETLFPLPAEYQQAVEEVRRKMAVLRSQLSAQYVTDSEMNALTSAIQAHFKEWLISSGNSRQLTDLMHLEKRQRNYSADSV